MSHLDWAMSMGIFIVAILTIFILIKPTAPPLYPEESIMPIVETNFVNDVYWTVKEIPLIIGECVETPWDVSVDIADTSNWDTKSKTTYKSELGDLKGKAYYLTFFPLDSTELSLELSGNCKAKSIIGAQESIRGISEYKLENLGTYAEIKTRWGYPQARDFQIRVNTEKLNKDMPDPYQNANVFVKQIKDFYVDEYGNLTKVDLTLEVW